MPPSDPSANSVEETPSKIVRVYWGAQRSDVVGVFAQDASELACFGYQPAGETWEAGRWGTPAFLVALLLTVTIVGLLMFLYMLVVSPDGTLEVAYVRGEHSAASNISASLLD